MDFHGVRKNVFGHGRNLTFWLLILALHFPSLSWAVYNLPSDRKITWNAGLDPVGRIPNYTNVTCTGLHSDGSVDDRSALQTCINNASLNTAVYIPAGVYKVSGDININKSNVVLRGAKASSTPWLPTADATATTLNISGRIYVSTGSQSGTWSPGAGQGTSITSGYTQGSTSITLSSASGYNINDYISVYQNSDASLPIDYRGASWLGEDNCSSYDCHVKQQFVKITNKSGNVLTIDPGIYMVTASPTGAAVRKLSFGVTLSGVENLRINGNGSNGTAIFFNNVIYCWAKGVETYNIAGGNGYGHIMTWFSKGVEIRDNYVHYGGPHTSGRSYGLDFNYWNSDHKVENNIISDTRHAIIFEGGGSGCAILYNYGFNNWEDDLAALTESLTQNHGAHPHMNLWEGNIDQQFYGDWTWGSSSHMTLFRNWVLGYRASPSGYTGFITAIRVGPYNRYYNILGNIAGISSWTSGRAICNSGSCGGGPHAFEFGLHTDNSYLDSGSYSTAILHGNYDYVTDGVAIWADSDHALTNSMYYNSKPSWYRGCTWPPVDPTVPTVHDMPAKLRYEGNSCPPGPFHPSSPANFRLIQ